MSWLFSQALVEEYLADTSLDGEQSVQSNGKPTQQAYCALDKMTDFSRLSRFGMTYKPLTESRGEELLTLFREDSHAKTLALLEKAQELTESEAECGEKWRASFTKYDPNMRLWKTHQCSLLEDLEEFLEIWPQWGLMRDGECWEQRTLEQTIRGIGFGLSPDGMATFHTPNTTGLDGGSNSRKALKKRMEKLPTPQATDHRSKPTSSSWKAKGGVNFSLANPEIQAKWPTPLASDWKARGPNSKQQGLLEKVKWPTPDANCGARGTQELWTPKRKSGHQAQYSINQAVRDAEKLKFPTPQASDHRDRGNMSNPSIQRRADKGKQLNLSMVAHPNSGQLNPTWVEWLMGWPIGWTDLKPLETDKSHFVPQPHGES
jgi:DNA (cytosine-5)-methyltransferase 1